MAIAIVCAIFLVGGLYTAVLLSGFVKPRPRISVLASIMALAAMLALQVLSTRLPDSAGFWTFVVLWPLSVACIFVGVASGGMGISAPAPARAWHRAGLILGMSACVLFVVGTFV